MSDHICTSCCLARRSFEDRYNKICSIEYQQEKNTKRVNILVLLYLSLLYLLVTSKYYLQTS